MVVHAGLSIKASSRRTSTQEEVEQIEYLLRINYVKVCFLLFTVFIKQLTKKQYTALGS